MPNIKSKIVTAKKKCYHPIPQNHKNHAIVLLKKIAQWMDYVQHQICYIKLSNAAIVKQTKNTKRDL